MVARRMMEEAEKIGRRIGVHFRVDIERRINGAAGVGAHRTSMLQDLEKGRPLEIDALLTVVQEMGRLVDVETPSRPSQSKRGVERLKLDASVLRGELPIGLSVFLVAIGLPSGDLTLEESLIRHPAIEALG